MHFFRRRRVCESSRARCHRRASVCAVRCTKSCAPKAVRALAPPRAGFPDRGGGYIDSDRGDSPARLARADAINPGLIPGLLAGYSCAITCDSSRRGVLTARNPILLLALFGLLLLRCEPRQLLELLFQEPPRNKRFVSVLGSRSKKHNTPQTGAPIQLSPTPCQ